MSIVSRVALSEKEVQIWFQNRRQNSRRRSKPISPHDVSPALSSSQSSMSLRHLHSSDDKEASPASVIDSEPIAPATDAEPEDIAIPDMSAKERSYNTNDEVESQESNMQAPCPQKSTVELRIAKSPDNLSNTTSLKPSQSPRYDRLTAPLLPVPSGTKPPGDDDSTLKSTLPTTNIVGYISNRRSAQTMTAALPMSAKTKSSQPLVPTARNEPQKSLLPRIPVLMKRSSSMIRLALSLEGKAEVVTGDGASIPHDQINYSRRISGRAGCLQRSQSLAEYTSYVAPDTGKTMMPLPRRSLSGRSRDSRTWQFYCDSDARNALSAKAEQEQSGSAVGAIELLRTRCINIMPAKKKRDAEAGKPDVTKRVKATATRTERPKLGRASSSLARLQNQRGDVGAGMAGLRCAEILIHYGIKVTILEGRDRIGGRVYQTLHQGHMVDDGPNWIHGTEGNPILDIAKSTTAVLHSWGESQNIFDERGSPVKAGKAAACTAAMWGIIADAFQYSNEHSHSISKDDSLLDFFKLKLNENTAIEDCESAEKLANARGAMLNTESSNMASEHPQENDDWKHKHEVEDNGTYKDQLLWMAEMWGAFVGDPVQRQSLKYFWLEECIEGENLFVATTYRTILQHVARIPLEQADIHHSRKVERISSIPEEPKNGAVAITTTDGQTQQFDAVVVTCPLGWLKRNQHAFSPALPLALVKAIDSISYGRLEKVYITFPTAFWHGISDSITIQNESFAGFSHFTHPLYASDTNPQAWNQEAMDLAALPAPAAHPTLLFYIYGPCSTFITDMLSSSPSSSHHEQLESFFRPYYSRLPNYRPRAAECVPTGIHATNWQKDDMAGFGSYCNFQVGLENGDACIERMREGMPDRKIYLAGEHTAPFVALGTVTGAYWSGETVADRVVHDLKKEIN
ncbi:MAG: hypothetical protein M1817_005974 [Caeruleum heppii]|nr:MAG: hypothetical protein M1817_005974 [Caeruleum heppii]